MLDQLRSGKRTMIETEIGPLDVVQGLPGVPSYEELQSRAVRTTVLDVNGVVHSLVALGTRVFACP